MIQGTVYSVLTNYILMQLSGAVFVKQNYLHNTPTSFSRRR